MKCSPTTMLAVALITVFPGCSAMNPEVRTLDRLAPGVLVEPDQRTALPPGVALRKVYDKGVELTKLSEGFESELYNDAAGYCTIGYGHLLKLARCDGSEPDEFRRGISEPRGTEILRDDMAKAERAVMTMTGVPLTDGQYAALCDFVFNVGGGNYQKSTLRKVINSGRHDEVPFQLRRWVKAGGRTLRGLQLRREKEIELYFDGHLIPRAAPPADADLSPIDIGTGE